MSTIIMSACWPLQGMSPAQKAVLISLADQANDQGVCWPAVDSIATRCCLSKRAVQQAIKWLRSVGIVSVEERQGRSTMYSVTPAAYAPPQEMHPSSKCTRAGNAPTPADAAPPPPQEMHPTPAASAPRTVIEPTREPSGNLLPADSGQPDAERDRQQACRAIWSAYAAAYQHRYGTHPVRNSKVNGQVRDLLKRLGAEEAPAVAAYFVGINDAYLIRNCHDLGSLLARAESYRTQWATDRQMNGATARQLERTQANLNAAKEAAESIREEGRANAFL
ncbi:helix-turn-helix domain-containing protein [Pseudomonas aeruginosa]|uniref:helix-turn-helix domain-containing protein n=14 Tax=Pseudomonas aeruginosa TaxID=287 RepID=UPI000595D919|nr:helix-turn-helix domain-containing protein [Pseudomonas aeruginosa]HCL2778290.1 helix-turn-helix domain-containing protein [Pseudomonas aeruginosa AC9A]MBG4148165.1 helix-turn-helix domain-containing protein [Pseudomonas aeruginosa]MBG4796868.1 helix-turn-helix domain-containing protein [Pseudomonas aeruginosa]MBG7472672.1 helix-turn-helix domain-containing protein [Pseudomonas aeruginosa]MBH9214106.1 helix-turn-helix domain-containing protein [Pseudomonas aeruginosa]